MKKFAAFLVLCVFSSLFIFAKGDDNWFMAQTKKATISSITATLIQKIFLNQTQNPSQTFLSPRACRF